MADAFTGECFLPECTGEIACEHWHRYVFARHVAAGYRLGKFMVRLRRRG
jgi:hypothetical protein